MHKLTLLAGAALGATLIWYLLPVSMPVAVTSGEAQSLPRVSAAKIPPSHGASASVRADAATAASAPIKVQAHAASGATTPSNSKNKAAGMPELTRALEQVQSVQMAGRAWSVLGTKDVVNGHGTQVVLVLRDELSGQLDYRQSALRVVLRDGVDYEAFISALPNAKRLFVNSLYGEIGVDAANIGTQYAALTSDARVLKVHFIPLAVPAKSR
jgi:hypothetical protein